MGIRRYRGWPVGEGDAHEWSVLAAVRTMYDLSETQAKSLILRYKDNEDDMCTLTELTLPDALVFAQNSGNVLRLAVSHGPLPSFTLAENSSVEVGDTSLEQGLQQAAELLTGRLSFAATRVQTAVKEFKQEIRPYVQEAGESIGELAAQVRSSLLDGPAPRVAEVSQEELCKSSTNVDDAHIFGFEVSTMVSGAVEQEGQDDHADSLSQVADVARHADDARTAVSEVSIVATGAYEQARQGDLAGSLNQLAGAAVPAATAARCFGNAMVAAGVSGIEQFTAALRSDIDRFRTAMTTTPDRCSPRGQ